MCPPKISVIVPIYNVEKYLNRCLDSILVQTFEDFEVILIDDGSVDKSGKICDDYVHNYPSKFSVFHQQNQGVTSARKLGVKHSHGEWINFVDADDTIPMNALLELYNASIKNKVDIVVASSQTYGERRIRFGSLAIKGLLSSQEYIEALLSGICGSGPVCKLFNREIFTDQTFQIPTEITNHEDLLMNLNLALNARNVIVYPGIVVYNYLVRNNSASHTNLEIKDFDKIFEQLYLILGANYSRNIKMYIVQVLYGLFRNSYEKSSYINLLKKDLPKSYYKDFYEIFLNALIYKDKMSIALVNFYKVRRRILRIFFFLTSRSTLN